MSPLTIFLDLGGVINDKDQQAAQWKALVGECLVGLPGGNQEAWTVAHEMVTARLVRWEEIYGPATDFVSFYRSYQLCWVRGMCELVGILVPSEEECLTLAYRAIASITFRVRAALAGAVEAIRVLHDQGYSLHMASGSCSLELAGYLEGMGIQHCFGRLYGADLVNTFKEGPEFYIRLFADTGIRPAEALVVDDSPDAINWAAATGARTVLVSASPCPSMEGIPRIVSLAQLPAFLHQ